MIRSLLLLACFLPRVAGAAPAASSGSTVSPAPPVSGHCENVTKATLTPACFLFNPDEQRRVGTPCALHPGVRLRADTIAIGYGFVSPEACMERPGLFINSRLMASGGCVVGRPFTNVAYCPACRRVREAWERTRGRRH